MWVSRRLNVRMSAQSKFFQCKFSQFVFCFSDLPLERISLGLGLGYLLNFHGADCVRFAVAAFGEGSQKNPVFPVLKARFLRPVFPEQISVQFSLHRFMLTI